MNLIEEIAGRIIVDCGKGSEYPCPHDEPVAGYEKCLHEDKDICIWQLKQATGIIQLIKKRLDSVELPSVKGVNIPFKANLELSMPAQKEIVDTAVMAYTQAEQDTKKAIMDALGG